MKLIRFGEPGKEKTGLMINGKRYDTSAFGEDYGERFFENDGLARLAEFAEDNMLPEITMTFVWAALLPVRPKSFVSALTMLIMLRKQMPRRQPSRLSL